MDIIAKLYKMSILMMWVKLHVPHCKGCVRDKIVANSRWAKVSGEKNKFILVKDNKLTNSNRQ